MTAVRVCPRTRYWPRMTGCVAVSAEQPSTASGAAGADCGGSRTRAGSAADGSDSRSGCDREARAGIRRSSVRLSRSCAASARCSARSRSRHRCRRCRTASWWRRIKILAICQASSRQDSRSHVAVRVTRRKTNRRHMTGDQHGQAAGWQACWSEPRTGFSARAGEGRHRD